MPFQTPACSIVSYPRHDEQPGRTYAYVMHSWPEGDIRTDQDGVIDLGQFEAAPLPNTFTSRTVHRRARRVAGIYQDRVRVGKFAGTPLWSELRFPMQLRALAERHATSAPTLAPVR